MSKPFPDRTICKECRYWQHWYYDGEVSKCSNPRFLVIEIADDPVHGRRISSGEWPDCKDINTDYNCVGFEWPEEKPGAVIVTSATRYQKPWFCFWR